MSLFKSNHITATSYLEQAGKEREKIQRQEKSLEPIKISLELGKNSMQTLEQCIMTLHEKTNIKIRFNRSKIPKTSSGHASSQFIPTPPPSSGKIAAVPGPCLWGGLPVGLVPNLQTRLTQSHIDCQLFHYLGYLVIFKNISGLWVPINHLGGKHTIALLQKNLSILINNALCMLLHDIFMC